MNLFIALKTVTGRVTEKHVRKFHDNWRADRDSRENEREREKGGETIEDRRERERERERGEAGCLSTRV